MNVETSRVRRGVPVRVRVPASSANLGPGFDALGLALDLVDEVEVVAVDGGDQVTEVEVSGEGAADLPRDGRHLVVRAVRSALAEGGAAQPGLRLRAVNAIPHGRGLGSSAAAVVAGVVAGRALLTDPEALDDAALLRLAAGLEGHPDNAAAALLGGLTIAWTEAAGPRAVRLAPHPDLRLVACIPAGSLSTAQARGLLPPVVTHADAAFAAGRAALLVAALTGRPDLLLPATEDRLHQEQRRPAMRASLALVDRLRARGLAAVVSGAGPSVLVLGVDRSLTDRVRGGAAGSPTWDVRELRVGEGASCTRP